GTEIEVAHARLRRLGRQCIAAAGAAATPPAFRMPYRPCDNAPVVFCGPAMNEPAIPGQARLRALRLRAALYERLRAFFAERGVLEVETPILGAAGNTEPNIESFRTLFGGHVDAGPRERWLRTSPEYPLKRLLAAG